MHDLEADTVGMFENAERRQWSNTQFDRKGFDIIHNTPDEILNLVLDTINQLNGITPCEYANKSNGAEYAPTIAPSAALKLRHLIE